jgi:hypothetical protein
MIDKQRICNEKMLSWPPGSMNEISTETGHPELILRRFTRNNAQHPAYKAFTELGKAIKTIYLCRYLASEELRREIHEGLNVVKSWNSTNEFIFIGKNSELIGNKRENQEMSLLCLHLLHASLVYVNTLMDPAGDGRSSMVRSDDHPGSGRPEPVAEPAQHSLQTF